MDNDTNFEFQAIKIGIYKNRVILYFERELTHLDLKYDDIISLIEVLNICANQLKGLH